MQRIATCALLMILLAGFTAFEARALEPFPGATYTAGGQLHTCALTTAGGVKCWGGNGNAQLGNGTTTDRLTPTTYVNSLSTGVAQLAVGPNHNCAITTAGAAKCWGFNQDGQLGTGSTTPGFILGVTSVTALGTNVRSIAAGDSHTCAVVTATPGDPAGTVKCWGANGSGQLGTGNTTNSTVPVDVVGLALPVKEVAVGSTHSCALLESGVVQCWGANSGRLGNGQSANSLTPVITLLAATGVKLAAANETTCAVLDTGALRCWGSSNFDGRLGNGTLNPSLSPLDVVGLSSVAGVAPAAFHTCAWTTAGATYCWGRNTLGTTGNGTFTSSPTPALAIAGDVANVGGKGMHTCATLASGEARCWGSNQFGQLGTGANPFALAPIPTGPLGGPAAMLSTGSAHTCVVLASGIVKCFGQNGSSQLARGTTVFDPSVGSVQAAFGAELSNVAAVSAGGLSTCALLLSGGVNCWGTFPGDGTGSSNRAVGVTGLASGATSVDSGANFSCAVTAAGGVLCWGNNQFGTMGNGTTDTSLTPTSVVGLPANATAVSAGNDHVCALLVSGDVYCWGANLSGQLGNGSTVASLVPVAVTSGNGAIAIAAGRRFTCALFVGGGVKCWGMNSSGQTGTGSFNPTVLVPTAVQGISGGVTAVSAGDAHACLITAAGAARCWGSNLAGMLGDRTRFDSSSPVTVVDLGAVTQISAGANHTCALEAAGTVKCWGDYTVGQLGTGAFGGSAVPVAVMQTDLTPNAFTFTPVTGVAPSSSQVSDTVTITSVDAPVPITVSDGEYSIGCNGSFTSSPGTIANGQTVCVRHVSSAAYNTTVTTTLVAGNATGTFSSTTREIPLLTIVVTGGGFVNASPGNYSGCGGMCTIAYEPGTVVTLTTTSFSTTFVGWINTPGCTGTAPCVFTMEESRTVTAKFMLTQGIGFAGLANRMLGQPPFSVSASADSGLPVSFSSQTGSTCTVTDTTVTLLATGVCTIRASVDGDELYAPAFLDRSFTITANQFTLTVIRDGDTGSGLVTSNLPGITCGSHCTADYAPGTPITLTAQFGSYYLFTGWSGVSCAGGNQMAYTCTFTINANVTATASFRFPFRSGVPRDLNNDEASDLVFQDAAGNIAAWTMNGTGVFDAVGLLPAGSGWSVTHIADFNSDGTADILLRHTDGRVLMWLMNSVNVTQQILLQPAGSGWRVTHAADMNADGRADLLWEHTDGTIYAWTMDGGSILDSALLQPAGSGWHITHIADLDGNGNPDILWQHADGTTVAWLMDGLTYLSSAGFTPAGSGWSITQTGDVNGDGKADLAWRNSSGAVMLWVMDGTNLLSFAALQLAGSPWRIDLIGDLDGDGKDDLVWRNTSDGSTFATLMNGTATLNAGYLMGGASGWTATHLLDLNGDGKRDVLWRYVDGTLATWLMNGLQPIAAAGLIGPSTWQVVPPQ